MTIQEVKYVIETHRRWLANELGGSRANLYRADLRGLDLSGVNLTGAFLVEADLRDSDLTGSIFHNADLRHVRFDNSNLFGADLRTNLLEGADFTGACLDYVLFCLSHSMFEVTTDDRFKIQCLYFLAMQRGDIADADLKELRNSDLFVSLANKFHDIKNGETIRANARSVGEKRHAVVSKPKNSKDNEELLCHVQNVVQ